MRMKKFLILASVALLAIACNKTYQVVPEGTEGTPIGFSTWAEQLTKARVQGSSTFAAGDDFAVYGYKETTSPAAKVTVFDGVTVSTTDGTAWDYENHRFWDTNYDAYTFFAVSPAASAGTVTAQTGAITSAATTFAGNDNDILVADKKTVLKTATPEPFGDGTVKFGVVPLVFNHVASLVDFKVKKAPTLSDATVKVSDFKLLQIENAGVLTVSDAYTDSHPVVSWSSTGTGTYTPDKAVTAVTYPVTVVEDSAFNPTTPATPAASAFLVNNLVVKPQEFGATGLTTSQQLSITYSITDAGGSVVEHTSTLYLADFDTVDNDVQTDTKVASWEPGKHYTFYITLDANVIMFSASITDWTAVSGYHYLIN